MGTLRVHEFISLDGVNENPSWTAPYGFTDEMGAALGGLTAPAGAILLGRSTFEMFAPAWSARSVEDDPGVEFFNNTTKHVVGSDVDTGIWQNSVAFGPYSADAVRELKSGRDVYTSGSGTLVRAMLADGVVDELHLFTYPLVLGAGARLFPEGSPNVPLTLLGQEGYSNGVLHLVYGPSSSS